MTRVIVWLQPYLMVLVLSALCIKSANNQTSYTRPSFAKTILYNLNLVTD